MHEGLHHFHKRKRLERGVNPNANPSLVLWMDRLITVVAILNPIFILPQLWDVWVDKQTQGVSVVSWTAFSIFSLCWLAYGLVHREKPLILSGLLLAILNGLVVVGVLIY